MHVTTVARIAQPEPALAGCFDQQDDPRVVRRRGHLHRPGEPLLFAYRVVSGWFGRFRTGVSGTEAVTAVYLPGDVIGLDALGDGRLGDEITALTDAMVLRLPIARLRDRVAAGGAGALEVAQLLADDARFLREAVFAIGTQSSTERMSTFVLQTYYRLLAAGVISPRCDQFALPLTQAQLGSVTGLTSVHVNRVLKRLRQSGLLELSGGVARILDMAGLRREAQRRE